MKGYHRVFKSQIVIFTVSYSKTNIYNLILIYIVSNNFIKIIRKLDICGPESDLRENTVSDLQSQ